MKTCVFLTTQTSASASMWRIFTTIIGDKLSQDRMVDKYFLEGNIKGLDTATIPEIGHLVLFNRPPSFNTGLPLEAYKFIINYRDPRDHFCNVFHWKLIHPNAPDEPKEAIELRAQQLRKQGIDDWVIHNLDINYYSNLFKVIEKTTNDQTVVLSYARLCLDFDSFIAKSATFLEVDLSDELLKQLEVERTEKLSDNPKWIGNQWAGSDVLPGRYLRELKPETIEYLNKKFEPILIKMAKYDPDYGDLYLSGLA